MSSIDVVVITYCYNQWIAGALGGIAAQSLQPRSVVVSDDCSPPPHGAQFLQMAGQYPWAHFVQTPRNLGTVEHVRLRVSQITSSYYLLVSADDLLIDKDFLRDAVAILDNHPQVVAVSGQVHQVDGLGRLRAAAPVLSSEPYTLIPGPQMRAALALENVVPAVCTVVRTAVHDQVPAFPIANPLTHDWLQWYLMARKGDFARINRPVMHYRVHEASLSQSAQRDRRMAEQGDEGYASLLQQPDLSPEERAELETGRIRWNVRHTLARELWRPLAKAPLKQATWSALAETLAERGSFAASRLHKRLRPKLDA